jgi:hypothetical protein
MFNQRTREIDDIVAPRVWDRRFKIWVSVDVLITVWWCQKAGFSTGGLAGTLGAGEPAGEFNRGQAEPCCMNVMNLTMVKGTRIELTI